MDHVAVARALVQVIDILRYQHKAVAQFLFQTGQREMRRIRRDIGLLELTTAGVIKRLHQFRIAGKAFRRGHVFHMMLFPQAIGRAESTNT